MFIRSAGIISPQHTFGPVSFLENPVETAGNRLTCMEPDYKDLIDPKMIRRMSRIIRMGVAAANMCLKEAGVQVPGAIITGTAYGCLQDTELFLTKMVEQDEEMLTPTAFIQSTHNTIGAQIGLQLKSHNYNNAFVHRGFSFESALLDAQMLLMDGAAEDALVGAIDELTDTSFDILNRFGIYKKQLSSNLQLLNDKTRGTIAGEGSSFFLFAKDASASDYCKLDGITTLYKPGAAGDVNDWIDVFLSAQNTKIEDIDVMITGRNGDINDRFYDVVEAKVPNAGLSHFKHLCGEYPTAVAFGVWIGAKILQTNTIPSITSKKTPEKRNVKKVLLYNHYMGIHHSLYLLSAC